MEKRVKGHQSEGAKKPRAEIDQTKLPEEDDFDFIIDEPKLFCLHPELEEGWTLYHILYTGKQNPKQFYDFKEGRAKYIAIKSKTNKVCTKKDCAPRNSMVNFTCTLSSDFGQQYHTKIKQYTKTSGESYSDKRNMHAAVVRKSTHKDSVAVDPAVHLLLSYTMLMTGILHECRSLHIRT